MCGCDTTKGAPVHAVGSEADGAAEHQAVSRLFYGPVGKNRAVEDLFRDVWVGGDDDSCLAEAEGHEPLGVEPVGNGCELAVSEARHEVHAPNEWEASWSWYDGVGPFRRGSPPLLSPCWATWVGPVEESRGEPCEKEKECEAQDVLSVGRGVAFCEEGKDPEVVCGCSHSMNMKWKGRGEKRSELK